MAFRSAAIRDTLTLLAVFAVLLGGLYLYTGTWPPAVIVESSSMMHLDSEVTYGRSWLTFGPPTIDPGDLVLVKNVKSVDDIETAAESGRNRFGAPGDVVVYYHNNQRDATPIIHRAVAYVKVVGTGENTEYHVRWNPSVPCESDAKKDGKWCVYGSEGVYVPSIPIQRVGSTSQNPLPYKPEHSGFLTKGDNPFTNRLIDQVTGLSATVKLEWIEGKGRGELPWLGLIKLSLADRINEKSPPSTWTKIGSAYAPQDLWVMLGATLFVLVGVPLIYDGYKSIANKRRQAATTGATEYVPQEPADEMPSTGPVDSAEPAEDEPPGTSRPPP